MEPTIEEVHRRCILLNAFFTPFINAGTTHTLWERSIIWTTSAAASLHTTNYFPLFPALPFTLCRLTGQGGAASRLFNRQSRWRSTCECYASTLSPILICILTSCGCCVQHAAINHPVVFFNSHQPNYSLEIRVALAPHSSRDCRRCSCWWREPTAALIAILMVNMINTFSTNWFKSNALMVNSCMNGYRNDSGHLHNHKVIQLL